MTHTDGQRPRGRRGAGRAQRRALQNVANDRQLAWLGKTPAGTADTSTVPLRIRISQLTAELDELYAHKRTAR
jgi:hypothetical protein